MKKSDGQLDREIDEVLQARQKRSAAARTLESNVLRGLATTQKSAPKRTAIPSQAAYERGESDAARGTLAEVERAPLADRKEAQADFLTAMRDPELIAERIGWLLNGTYGHGEMTLAQRILAAPRSNRSAGLTHLIGAFEWKCPQAMAVAAWKKLSKSEQTKLESAVQRVIKNAGEA